MQILLTFAANVCKDVAITIQLVNLLTFCCKIFKMRLTILGRFALNVEIHYKSLQ